MSGIQIEKCNYSCVSCANTGQDPLSAAFNVVVGAFRSDNAERRPDDALNADECIEQPISSYKRALLVAEHKPNAFRSNNFHRKKNAVRAQPGQLCL